VNETPVKNEFTEQEAADVLGVTTAELRQRLRMHVLTQEEYTRITGPLRFRRSDLLLLRYIAGTGTASESPASN
jgi:hypothetical protein